MTLIAPNSAFAFDVYDAGFEPLPEAGRLVAEPPPAARALSARAGETLFREGDRPGPVLRVAEGAARLVLHAGDGRRAVVGFAFAGELVGAVRPDACEATAEAAAPCRLEIVTGADARFRLAEQRLARAQVQIALMARPCALERVCGLILHAETRLKPDGAGEGVAFPLPMDRRDMADYLGLTLETVSRRLAHLREAGVIDEPAPRTVRVRARAALRRCAGGAA